MPIASRTDSLPEPVRVALEGFTARAVELACNMEPPGEGSLLQILEEDFDGWTLFAQYVYDVRVWPEPFLGAFASRHLQAEGFIHEAVVQTPEGQRTSARARLARLEQHRDEINAEIERTKGQL